MHNDNVVIIVIHVHVMNVQSLHVSCTFQFLYFPSVVHITDVQKKEDEHVPIHFVGHFTVS